MTPYFLCKKINADGVLKCFYDRQQQFAFQKSSQKRDPFQSRGGSSVQDGDRRGIFQKCL